MSTKCPSKLIGSNLNTHGLKLTKFTWQKSSHKKNYRLKYPQ